MILELAAVLFSATGVFTGSASCEKMAEGAVLRLHMNVESTDPRVPADSISRSLARLSESVKKLSLKSTGLVLGESSEGAQSSRASRSDEPSIYYASKEITATSSDFNEVQVLLDVAAAHGFQMRVPTKFFVRSQDSLNNACIEKATRNALERAEIGRKALGGKSMTILKITDSESFQLYTSDDTRAADEQVDDFFSSTRGKSSVSAFRTFSGTVRAFYRISPEPIRVTSSVKVLVDIHD